LDTLIGDKGVTLSGGQETTVALYVPFKIHQYWHSWTILPVHWIRPPKTGVTTLSALSENSQHLKKPSLSTQINRPPSLYPSRIIVFGSGDKLSLGEHLELVALPILSGS
jgi:hypothetical protein